MDSTQSIVSIIIPVWNNLSYTRNCLKALLPTLPDFPHEIIVVDNGSTDGSDAYLSSVRGIRVLRNDHNLGFARACNQGAAAGSGQLFVFLNNDTIPHHGWLAPLLEVMKSDPSVAVVGSKLIYPGGRIQHAGVAFGPGPEGVHPFHIYQGERSDAPHVNRQRDLQAVTAACVIVRRDTFAELGGFDERFVNSCEDLDFCLRARERGLRIVYEPRSVVTHYESRTPGRHQRETENQRLFNARWTGRVLPDYRLLFEADGQDTPWVFQTHEAQLLYDQGKTGEGDTAWRAVLDRLLATRLQMLKKFPSRQDLGLAGPTFAEVLRKTVQLVGLPVGGETRFRNVAADLLLAFAYALYATVEKRSAALYCLLKCFLRYPIGSLKTISRLLKLNPMAPAVLIRPVRSARIKQ